MLSGEIRNQIDALWNTFWTGGISNPLEVIEQITYLLFLRRLDDLQELEERKATRLGKPIAHRFFPEGVTDKGRTYEDLRWSRFRHKDAREMFETVADRVFPYLRRLGGDGTTYVYADSLETRFGQRPVIFLSTGYEHEIWDDTQHPGRPVQGFCTRDELELLIQRRTTRRLLKDIEIDRKIVDSLLPGTWHPPHRRGVRKPPRPPRSAGHGHRRGENAYRHFAG